MGFSVGSWDYGRFGGSGFGMKDVRAAQNAGASSYQIKQLAQRASSSGLNVGRDARTLAASVSSPWAYAGQGHGGYGFGMKDVNAIGDLDTVKRYRDWAVQNSLNIGPAVQGWINSQEQKRQNEQMQEMMIDQYEPGTQTGAHNVNNYSAAGLRTPRPENFDINTGGTTDAFGIPRPFKPQTTASALSINPLTGIQ